MPIVRNIASSVLSRAKRGAIFPDGEPRQSLQDLFDSPVRWVILGCVLVVILAVILTCCVCWCRKRRHTDKVTDSARAPFVLVHTLQNTVYLPTTEPLVPAGPDDNHNPASSV